MENSDNVGVIYFHVSGRPRVSQTMTSLPAAHSMLGLRTQPSFNFFMGYKGKTMENCTHGAHCLLKAGYMYIVQHNFQGDQITRPVI